MSGATPLPPSAARVQAALDAHGGEHRVVIVPDSTRTSEEAARAVGCDVAAIAKSLIFKIKATDTPVLVIASGAKRVDEKKVAALVGGKIGRADADFVRATTGYAIGGVPPLAHDTPAQVLIDQDILSLTEVWAAAGTPNAVFKATPEELVALSGGRIADVRKD